MNIALVIYLIGVLHSLGCLAVFGMVAGTITLAVCLVVGSIEGGEVKIQAFGIARKLVPYLITCTIMVVLIPDKKEAYMIVGVSETMKVLQTPEAAEIGGKALQLLNQKIEEELKPEPVKEK